jgi:excinuclease UvrABC nuclease subunit
MDFEFHDVAYDPKQFIELSLPEFPKRSGVYKIFDTRQKLIVLDKTSNLHERMERFFGERSEMLRDLDLRKITSRISFRSTDSPFETIYLLYRERRSLFPRTYRKMRTFRFFTLMKINRKQRFPRIYATRQVKAGVDYFGPFVTRGQFTRMKTTLERTFKLRPCLYNIRGNDPHPDCLYFQMHTCSRPCNNDIDRAAYLRDLSEAMDFIQGHDVALEEKLTAEMNALAAATDFESAETVRRRLEKIRRARQEARDTFYALWTFRAIALLPSDSVARCKIAFVREGIIAGFEEYAVEELADTLPADVDRFFNKPLEFASREWQYDEFCLVSNFIVDPLQSVDVILFDRTENVTPRVIERIQRKKRKRKQSHVDTVA